MHQAATHFQDSKLLGTTQLIGFTKYWYLGFCHLKKQAMQNMALEKPFEDDMLEGLH